MSATFLIEILRAISRTSTSFGRHSSDLSIDSRQRNLRYVSPESFRWYLTQERAIVDRTGLSFAILKFSIAAELKGASHEAQIDKVIKLLLDSLRLTDICTFDGGEFLVLLRNTDRDGATIAGARLQSFAEFALKAPVDLSVDFGVDTFPIESRAGRTVERSTEDRIDSDSIKDSSV